MTPTPGSEGLRDLPAVHELAAILNEKHPEASPSDIRKASRKAIEKERKHLLGGGSVRDAEAILKMAEVELKIASESSMENVINATGIVLHTAIGRACLPPAAVEAVTRVASGYSVLQWDRETGRRGHRDAHVEDLICRLTGCEAATLANNNAGATLLVLSALARGREVIVSRGQLVEIGGSFRIPEVMKQSGAQMREVGCTNRTHLRDYREAINENTAVILRVHPSNYRIRGFTGEVPLEDLVTLGREHGIPVVDDLGAGSLVDLSEFGLPSEPTVMSSIDAGADVVTSSGDKLIGGPQAGIIVGTARCLELIRKHPLARALRVGKLTIAALEAALRLFEEDPAYLVENHPVYFMFARKLEELRKEAERLMTVLSLPSSCSVSVIETESFVGSGSLPDYSIPSFGVGISCPDPELLSKQARLASPAVASRIEDGMLKLDVRTLQPGELDILAGTISLTAGELWA